MLFAKNIFPVFLLFVKSLISRNIQSDAYGNKK